MARYSLFVLKVPLNTKQASKQLLPISKSWTLMSEGYHLSSSKPCIGPYAWKHGPGLAWVDFDFRRPRSEGWPHHGSSFSVDFCCPLLAVLFL